MATLPRTVIAQLSALRHSDRASISSAASALLDALDTHTPVWCEHCGIVETSESLPYCDACLDELCSDLYDEWAGIR